MDSVPAKYFSMTWRMMLMGSFMMSCASSMCIDMREISVWLHEDAHEDIEVRIGLHDVLIEKNATYNVAVSDTMRIHLFYHDKKGIAAVSLPYSIKDSTISVVLKPALSDTGSHIVLDCKAEQRSFFYSVYSAIAELFLGNA
jgi:hypothetical protein